MNDIIANSTPVKENSFKITHTLLTNTGLAVSPIGFGTYRVDVRVPLHRAALAKAIRMGINLIDTSTNYAGGNSERLIGAVVNGLIQGNAIKRENIVIVSKGGYIQGDLYERMVTRANIPNADYSAGSELSELVRYSQGLWHSIHPDFLRDEISHSLERLEMEKIDIYLLHNPEYYIQRAIKEGEPEEDVRIEYERRIKQAFEYLETEVERGRISWYGISSNTFNRPEESVDRTSLERVLKSAEEIIKEQGLERHHFAAIQLPFNLFEPQALTEKNQQRGTKSVIEFAREHGIAVLINRPLNAISHGQLTRLADFPEREFPPEEEMQDLVHDLALQETEFKNGLLKEIALSPQDYDAVKQLLSLGKSLDGQWMEFHSVEEWQDISQTILAPRIQHSFDTLRPTSQTDKRIFEFLSSYAESADLVMEHVSNYYSTRGYERADKLHQVLNAFLPGEYLDMSLSQKAVLLIRSVPGVSCVLIGARSEEYVEDVVYGLQLPPIENAEEIWKKLAEMLGQ